jgi:hypothetical protein
VIRILLYLVVIVALVYVVRRFLSGGLKPAISLTSQGVAVGNTVAVTWQEIRQIDVCRMPTAGGSAFSVTLLGTNALTLNNSYRNFDGFTAKMFERWPAIRSEWLRVLSGPPDISERVTVWQQD